MRFNSLLFDLLRKPFLYEKQNQNQLVLISSVKSKIYKSNLVYIYIYITTNKYKQRSCMFRFRFDLKEFLTHLQFSDTFPFGVLEELLAVNLVYKKLLK